ncbi:MAG: Ig-like domain-containing protein [Treponema sp.]|nr:Ig-like domain-containing protein [Treponema sp.]
MSVPVTVSYIIDQSTDEPVVSLSNASMAIKSADSIKNAYTNSASVTNIFGTASNNKLLGTVTDDDGIASISIAYDTASDGQYANTIYKNDAVGGTTSFTIPNASFNELPEGLYYLKITVADKTQATSYATYAGSYFAVAVDNGGPAFSSVTPANGGYYSSSKPLTVSGTVTDSSGVVTITTNSGNGTGSPQVSLKIGSTTAFTLADTVTPPAADGSYAIVYTAADRYGQTSSYEIDYMVDTTAPSVFMPSTTSNFTKTTTKSVEVYVSDQCGTDGTPYTSTVTSGIATVAYSINGGSGNSGTLNYYSKYTGSSIANINTYYSIYKGTIILTDGVANTITYTITDNAGNSVTYTDPSTYTVDATAPVIKIDNGTSSINTTSTNSGDLSFTIDATDNKSIADLTVSGITNSAGTTVEAGTDYTVTTTASTATEITKVIKILASSTTATKHDGKWSFTINATDSAGWTAETRTITAQVDSQKPKITVDDTAERNVVYNVPQSYSGTMSDNIGVTGVYYVVMASNVAPVYDSSNSSWKSAAVNTGSGTWAVTADLSSTAYNTDDTWYIFFAAKDALGNAAVSSVGAKVTLDRAAPEVEITSPGLTTTSKTDVTVSGTVKEKNLASLVVTATKNGTNKGTFYTFDETTSPKLSELSTGVAVEWSFTLPALSDHTNDGTWVFTVTAKDKAGQSVSKTVSSILIDTTAPVISVTNSELGNNATIIGTSAYYKKSGSDYIYTIVGTWKDIDSSGNAGSGAKTLEYSTDYNEATASWSNWQIVSGTTTTSGTSSAVSFEAAIPVGQGTDKNLALRATDAKDIVSVVTSYTGITFDYSAPTLTMGTPVSYVLSTTSETTVVTGTYSDTDAMDSTNPITVTATYGSNIIQSGENGYRYSTSDGTVKIYLTGNSATNNGLWTFDVKAKDIAGQEKTVSGLKTTVDTIAPDVSNLAVSTTDSMTDSGITYFKSTLPLTFTVNSTDTGGSGVSRVTYAAVKGNYSAWSSSATYTYISGTASAWDETANLSGGVWKASITDFIALGSTGDGDYTIFAKATDVAGNEGISAGLHIVADCTVPTLAEDDGIGTYTSGTTTLSDGTSKGFSLSGTLKDSYFKSITATRSINNATAEDITLTTNTTVGTIDGKTVTSGTWSYEQTVPDTGTYAYTYTITATDKAGNKSYVSKSVSIDRTAPNVVVTSFAEQSNQSSYSFEGSASDEGGSQLKGIYVWLDTSSAAATTTSGSVITIGGTSSSWIWNTYNVESGNYYLHAVAVDNADNTSTDVPKKLIVDTTVPTTSWCTSSGALYTTAGVVETTTYSDNGAYTMTAGTTHLAGSTFVLKGNVDDNSTTAFATTSTSGEGFVSMAVTKDGSSYSGGEFAMNSDGVWTYTYATTPGDGTYVYTLTMTDAAGNTIAKSLTVLFDATAPVLSITKPTSNANETATTIALAGVTSDMGCGVKSISYTITNGTETLVSSSSDASDGNKVTITGGSWTATATPTGSSEGTLTFSVTATDYLGHTNPQTVTFYRDKTAPAISNAEVISGNANNLYATSTIGIQTEAADATSGVTSVTYSLDGTTWIPMTLSTGDQKAGIWKAASIVCAEGSNTIRIRATDAVSNTTAAADYVTISPKIDTKAPVLTTQKPATLHLTKTEADAGVSVSATATDVTSGTVKMWISTVSTADAAASYIVESTTTATTSAYTLSLTIPAIAFMTAGSYVDGNYTFYVHAIDAVGNEVISGGITFSLDTAAPVLTISNLASGSSSSSQKVYTESDVTDIASGTPRTATYTVSGTWFDKTSGTSVLQYTTNSDPANVTAESTATEASAMTTDAATEWVTVQNTTAVTNVTVSWTAALTVKESSGNSISFRAKDVYGNVTTPASYSNITFDFSAPVISAISLTGGTLNTDNNVYYVKGDTSSHTFKAVATVTDGLSIAESDVTATAKLGSTEYTEDNTGKNLTIARSLSGKTVTVTFTIEVPASGGGSAVEDGEWAFSVSGTDAAKRSGTAVSASATVDTIAPEPVAYNDSTYPFLVNDKNWSDSTWYKTTSMKIKGYFTENTSGLDKVYYYVKKPTGTAPGTTITDQSSVSLSGSTGTDLPYTFTLAGFEADNGSTPNTLYIQAVDKAGNVSALSNYTVHVDQDDPTFASTFYTFDDGATHGDAGGTVLASGKKNITIYGIISDTASGVKEGITFTVGGTAVTPTSLTYTAATDLTDWTNANSAAYSTYDSSNKTLITGWKAVIASGSIASGGAVKATPTDTAGNGSAQQIFTIAVDKTSPTVTLSSTYSSKIVGRDIWEDATENTDLPPDTGILATINGKATFAGTATDNYTLSYIKLYYSTSDSSTTYSSDTLVGTLSDTAAYSWSFSQLVTSGLNMLGTGGNCNVAYTGTSETVYFKLVAADTAGNESVYVYEYTIDPNADKPIIKLTNLVTDGSSTLKNSSDIFGTITDDDGTVISLQMKNAEGDEWTNVSLNGSSFTYTVTGGDGVKSLYFNIKDAAETTFTTAASSSLTTPRLLKVYKATSLVSDNSYTINYVGTTDFTAIGAGSNTVGTVFTASGAGTGTGTAYRTDDPYLETPLFFKLDTTQPTIGETIIVDRTNEGMAETPSFTFKDREPLTTNMPFGGSASGKFKLRIPAADANGIASVAVKLNGTSYSSTAVFDDGAIQASSIQDGNTYAIASISSTDFTDFGAGENTVGTVFTANRNGTSGDTGTVERRIKASDIIKGSTYKIASVGTTAFDTDFGATNNTVDTEFTASRDGISSDGTGTVYQQVYETDVIDVSGIDKKNDGAFSLSVMATDTSTLTVTTSMTILVDNTPPTVTHSSPSAQTDALNGEVTVKGTASDDTAGLASVQYKIGMTALEQETGWTATDGTFSWEIPFTASGSLGKIDNYAGKDVTLDSSTDTFTLASHGYSDGDKVWFDGYDTTTSSSSLAGKMVTTAPYYVINKTADTFQVAGTSGSTTAVDFSSNGSNLRVSKYSEDSDNDGVWDLPILVRATDKAGNVYSDTLSTYILWVDPDGDLPNVTIGYPDPDNTNRVLGGTIRIFGSAKDDDAVGSVYMMIDVDGDGDYDASDTVAISGTTTDWYNGGAGQKVNGTTSWNETINASSEFNSTTSGTTRTIHFKVRAKDINGVYGPWTTSQTIIFDDTIPKIGTSQALMLENTDGSITRNCVDDMWIKGNWYLTGSIEDESGISSVTVSTDTGSDVTVSGNLSTSGWFTKVTDFGNGKSGYTMKIPISSTAGSTGKIAFTITAVDSSTPATSNSKPITINFDNEAPMVGSYGGTTPITNSNRYYTVTSDKNNAVTEIGSGLSEVAFYFVRTTTSDGTKLYNPMVTDAYTKTSDLVEKDGLYCLSLGTVTRPTEYTLTVADISANANIREGGLVYIGGMYHRISAISTDSGTTTITWEDSDVPQTVTTAWAAYALVVDNETEESATWSDGKITSITNDDGDGVTEYLQKASTDYQWSAIINSQNIPDGPVILYYVAIDAAGNYTAGYTDTTNKIMISNNPPLLAGVTVGTDLTGDGDTDDENEKEFFSALSANEAQASAAVASSAFILKGNSTFDIDVVGGNGSLYSYLTQGGVTPTYHQMDIIRTADEISVTLDKDTDTFTATEDLSTGTAVVLNGDTMPSVDGSVISPGTRYYVLNAGNKTFKLATSKSSSVAVDFTAVGSNLSVGVVTTITLSSTAGSTELGSDTASTNYVFTIWDSTEETTVGTDSQKAVLTVPLIVDAVDGNAPNVTVRPFYWNSATSNSLFDNSSANGHIDISSGTYNGTDPDVSGKISICGFAYDDSRLTNIYAYIGDGTTATGDFAFTGQSTKTVNGLTYALVASYSSGSWTGSGTSDLSGGWYFTVTENSLEQDGHRISWQLDCDSSKITNGAALNRVIRIAVEDKTAGQYNPDIVTSSVISGTNGTRTGIALTSTDLAGKSIVTGNTVVLSSGSCDAYATKVKTYDSSTGKITFDTEDSINPSAVNFTVYLDADNKPSYQVDVVPYITNISLPTPFTARVPEITTSTNPLYGKAGWYPMYQGASSITISGFNLPYDSTSTIGTNDSLSIGSTTYAASSTKDGSVAAINGSAKERTSLTLTIANAQLSGTLAIKTNSVDAINNSNTNNEGYNTVNEGSYTDDRNIYIDETAPVIAVAPFGTRYESETDESEKGTPKAVTYYKENVPVDASTSDLLGHIEYAQDSKYNALSVKIDTDTEKLTATSHGMVTGQVVTLKAAKMPEVSNTTVASANVFYVVKLAADTFQLATTLDNLITGTVGTGTTTSITDSALVGKYQLSTGTWQVILSDGTIEKISGFNSTTGTVIWSTDATSDPSGSYSIIRTADIANFTDAGTTVTVAHPDISGEVIFRGKAYDDQRIKKIAVTIAGYNSSSAFDVYDATKTTPVQTATDSAWIFAIDTGSEYILSQDRIAFGQVLNWSFTFNTAKISTVAANNVTVTFTVTDYNNVPHTATSVMNVDVVPYITKLTTALSSLKSNKPSVYNRTALGHYPINDSEKITMNGFNLTGASITGASSGDFTVTNGVKITLPMEVVLGSTTTTEMVSGALGLSVNGVSILNNSNDNSAEYNQQHNGDNNNLLTDDVVLDVWHLNSAAALPIRGSLTDPVMRINPNNHMIGFAFVNGPAYFSMSSGVNPYTYAGSTNAYTPTGSTSYQLWQYNYADFSNVSFVYDDAGNAHGTVVGLDTEPTQTPSYGGDFTYVTSKWGVGNLGSTQDNYSPTNKLRLESIGVPNNEYVQGTLVTDTHGILDTHRFRSPSIVTATHGTDTAVYLAYYDDIQGQIRFRWGNPVPASRANFDDQFHDGNGSNQYNVDQHIFEADSDQFSLIAGKESTDTVRNSTTTTPNTAGEYVAIDVIPGATTADDVVVAVWYDGTNLMYSYKIKPCTDNNAGSGSGNGYWSTAQQIFTNGGEYCAIKADNLTTGTSKSGIHIVAYDTDGADLRYAYLSSYDASYNEGTDSCVVDSYALTGTNITIDTVNDTVNGTTVAIPYISYYMPSTQRPKMAYLVKPDTGDINYKVNGAESDEFTGKWEVTLIPTSSRVQADRVNVGIWKDTSGKMTYSTTDGVAPGTTNVGTSANDPNKYFGTCYGNGTKNPVLGYAIKNNTSGAIETAQMK